jgi:hypothetical protein
MVICRLLAELIGFVRRDNGNLLSLQFNYRSKPITLIKQATR